MSTLWNEFKQRQSRLVGNKANQCDHGCALQSCQDKMAEHEKNGVCDEVVWALVVWADGDEGPETDSCSQNCLFDCCLPDLQMHNIGDGCSEPVIAYFQQELTTGKNFNNSNYSRSFQHFSLF